eukprot:650177-Pelagomonas_calceolata.AAC.4
MYQHQAYQPNSAAAGPFIKSVNLSAVIATTVTAPGGSQTPFLEACFSWEHAIKEYRGTCWNGRHGATQCHLLSYHPRSTHNHRGPCKALREWPPLLSTGQRYTMRTPNVVTGTCNPPHPTTNHADAPLASAALQGTKITEKAAAGPGVKNLKECWKGHNYVPSGEPA